ncbi:MAG: hypothetical protein KBT45_00395 [Bacteroidales bacterium]|nr:hypothetical protein [Candidatus Colimorpha pelethequi]
MHPKKDWAISNLRQCIQLTFIKNHNAIHTRMLASCHKRSHYFIIRVIPFNLINAKIRHRFIGFAILYDALQTDFVSAQFPTLQTCFHWHFSQFIPMNNGITLIGKKLRFATS